MNRFRFFLIGFISFLTLTLFLVSYSFIEQCLLLPLPKANLVEAESIKTFGNKRITFDYSDDNSRENLIIKTDKETYVGLTQAEVYFSVTNKGNKTESVNFQVIFPDDKGDVRSIERWVEGIPYEVEVADYGPVGYFCQEGWQEFTETLENEEPWSAFRCESTGEVKSCDSLNEEKTNCIIDKVQIGSHKETRYKNKWQSVNLSANPLETNQEFFEKLFDRGIRRRSIPRNFKVKKSSGGNGFFIEPNQTQYFKMEINFPLNSSGEFYIEAIGDKGGYGLLDPWWNSSWSYRMPITIDNSGNSNTLTDYQIYVEITSTQSSFWSHVRSDGGDVRFTNNADPQEELDYWMQYWDYSNQKAAFWVQVDSITASASTTIYMYYGNDGAATTSDEAAPFTYSSMQDLFYVVRSDLSGASVRVVSLVDNNQVQLDSQTPVSLDKQEIGTFSSPSSTSVLRAKGPVHAKLIGGSTYDALAPISFAATQFVIPSTRGTETFYIYAPFATSTVTIYDGTTQEQQSTVNQGSVWTIQNDISTMAIIEATQPVLVAFKNSNPADAIVAYPTTDQDLYGIRSNYNYIGIASNSTNFNIYCSGGSSTSVTNQSRGTLYSNTTCSKASEGTGNAVRLSGINNGIGAIQQADSDGYESTVFLPPAEFGTEYIVPTDCAYLSIACAPDQGTVDLSIYDEDGNFVTSGSCAGSGNNPGQVRFGDNDSTTYNAGSRIVSTNGKPFYVYYEDTTASGTGGGDENNLWSWPQARKYSSPHPSYSFGSEEYTTESILTQNYYRWYVNTNNITPSDPWPQGATDLGENQAISSAYAVNNGDVLRLRVSVQVSNASLSANSQAFKLQYGTTTDGSCANVGSWSDVGGIGSGEIWRGYNNTTPADGATLTSHLLSVSDTNESYEEANNSVNNPNAINVGQDGEWDWVIENNNAPSNTQYCFRMIKSNGYPLNSYNNYPKLITNTPPNVPTQTKLFDNEKTSTTTPSFEFSATDSSNDDLIYQIQWDTDYNFSSPATKTSDTDSGFENIDTPSDTDPFNSGDTIRFTIQSADALTDGQTYWWRVRAKDPNGSNEWGEWSEKRSFTIDTSVTVSTWFQTTDEQFDTDSHNNTIVTGNNSVRTHTIIGEYNTVTLTNENYSTVNLNNYYNDLIVVASPRYSGSSELARSVRIKNKTHTSFQIKVDAYDGVLSTTTTVDWIAMDAGSWTIEDGSTGIKIIAGTKNVSALGGNYGGANWGSSEVVSFSPTFNGTPIVLHSVSSDNDTSWVTSHVDNGSSYSGDPSSSQMGLILNYSKTPNNNHSPEYIDYIAADQGSGTNNGVTFDIVKSSDSIEGYLNTPPYNVSYGGVFSSVPEVSVVAQLGEDGGDGGWAITYGTPTQTDHPAAIDEANSTTDRKHTTEPVGVFAFDATSGNIKQYDADAGRLISTPIDFDWGNSSAWGQLSWDDDETNGDLKYQIEYWDGDSWELIPDSDLSGNSTGFDTSPVDLSGLNTTTYNQIRIRANFSYSSGSPTLQDWMVSWKNQPPTVDSVSISPSPIDLKADSITTVTITATISDSDGCEDVLVNGSITGVFYDAGVETDNCRADDNNCYPNLTFTEIDDTCSGAGDTTAEVRAKVEVWFIANASTQWTAKVTVTDSQSNSASNTQTVAINELAAFKLDVSSIDYGTVNPGEVSTEKAVKITTTGNMAVDVKLSGTDLTWSDYTIPVGQQKYASSTGFDWETQGTALTETPTCYELSTGKPTQHPSNQSEYIYWKLKVPLDKPAEAYTGSNTFDVVTDNSCP